MGGIRGGIKYPPGHTHSPFLGVPRRAWGPSRGCFWKSWGKMRWSGGFGDTTPPPPAFLGVPGRAGARLRAAAGGRGAAGAGDGLFGLDGASGAACWGGQRGDKGGTGPPDTPRVPNTPQCHPVSSVPMCPSAMSHSPDLPQHTPTPVPNICVPPISLYFPVSHMSPYRAGPPPQQHRVPGVLPAFLHGGSDVRKQLYNLQSHTTSQLVRL